MSKQLHTPGPWRVGVPNIRDEAEVGIHGPGEYGFIICDMQLDGYDEKTQKANTNLICAAPDLLEALELSVSEYERLPHSLGYEFTHLPSMRAAIARAKGEQA